MIKQVILCHLSDPTCKLASIGPLYALCIAANPALAPQDWAEIDLAVAKRWPPKNAADKLRRMDQIKADAWRLYDRMAKASHNLKGGAQ